MPSSSTEEDIMIISQKLVKLTKNSEFNDATALELIEALEKMRVNIDILTKTRIGMALNEFRKNVKDDKVAKRCKLLIKRWKALLEEKSATVSRSSTRSQSPEDKLEKKIGSIGVSSIPQKNGTTTGSSMGGGGRLIDVRSKSAEMLTNALRSGELPSGTLDPEELARRIENRLYEFHRGTTDKYKAALRSRVFNLRDKKNQALRENVLTGAVSAEKFATMATEEMASEEMKKTREAFTKESILEHQMSVQEGTPTDMFRCGKCGKNNCTYSQMQTRSADEPMTTFVFCRSCGNRWKFC